MLLKNPVLYPRAAPVHTLYHRSSIFLLGEPLTATHLTRHHSNHLHEVHFTTEVLVRSIELTNHQQPESRKDQKGGTSPYVLTTSQNSPRRNPSWLSDVSTNRKDPESERLARHNLESNPITVKSETASHMVERSPGLRALLSHPSQ